MVRWVAALMLGLSLSVPGVASAQGRANTPVTVYRVGASNNFPPINYLDAQGELAGFGRDIATAVVRALGGEVVYTHSGKWLEIVDALHQGRIDFIHDTAYTPEREKDFSFTQPILSMDEVIFVGRERLDITSFEHLKFRKVACVKGHVTHQYLKNFPEINCVVVGSPLEGLNELILNHVEAFVYPRQIVEYLAQKGNHTSHVKMVGEPLRRLHWAMSMRKGDDLLQTQLNQGINAIKASGEYQAVYEKHFGRTFLGGYTRLETTLIFMGVFLAALLLGGGSAMGYFLVRQRRTHGHLRRLLAEKYRTEALLRESRTSHATIINAMEEGVWVVDPQFNILFVNDRLAHIFNTPPEAMVGSKSFSYFDDTVRDRLDEIMQARSEGKSDQYDYRYVREDGTVIWLLVSGAPHYDGNGNFAGAVAMFLDITKRKLAEEALAENERRYRILSEHSLQGILIQRDFTIVYANQAMANIYGFDNAEEMIGRSSLDFAVKSEHERLRTINSRWRSEGDSPEKMIIEGVDKNGRELLVEAINRPLMWEGALAVQSVRYDITQRYMAEMELRENQHLLRTIIDSIPHWLQVKGTDRRLKLVNHAFARDLGATAAELEGRATQEYQDQLSQDIEMIDKIDRQVLETGEPYTGLGELKGRNQPNTRIHQFHKVPLRDEHGDIQGIITISEDISEIKRAEQELEASKRLLQTVLDTIPHGVFVKDTQSRYLMVNRTMADLYASTPQQMLGHNTIEMGVGQDDGKKLLGEDQQVITTGARVEVSGSEVALPGTGMRVWDTVKLPLLDDAGHVTGLVGIQIDVSERVAMTQAMAESEARYRALVDGSILGVFIHTWDVFHYANQAVAEMFGYDSPDELIGNLGVEDVTHPDSVKILKAQDDKLKRGETIFTQFQGVQKDGTVIWLEAFSKVVDWENGRAVQSTVNNITDRKQAEERLVSEYRQREQLQLKLVETGKLAAMGELAAGIAHEINNPLAIIASSAELVEDMIEMAEPGQPLDPGETIKHMQTIGATVFRCKEIIQALLKFARQDSELLGSVDLRHLIEDTLRLVRSSAQARHRVLQLFITESDGTRSCVWDNNLNGAASTPTDGQKQFLLRTSKQQVQQLLLNLLINAVQATDEKGLIEVNLRQSEGGLETTVSDNGMGIPEDLRQRIFEPLFSTKPEGVGTGMGLSLCQQIAVSLGGRIGVQSTLGVGTTFTVWFPLERDPLEHQLGS